MTQRQLDRLRRDIERLRARPEGIRSRDLVSIAVRLGRERRRQRTGEPTYISRHLPNSRPISIPSHPGNLRRGTAQNILDALEGDIFGLEAALQQEEKLRQAEAQAAEEGVIRE